MFYQLLFQLQWSQKNGRWGIVLKQSESEDMAVGALFQNSQDLRLICRWGVIQYEHKIFLALLHYN